MPSPPPGFFSDPPSPDGDGAAGSVIDLFLELADLDPDEQTGRLNAIPDEALRAEVAALLAADSDAEAVLGRLDRLGASAPMADTMLGPYRIESEIGRGGMGVVYRAEDTRLGRTVALKVLPSHLGADPDARARLIAEARAASALDHPNVGTLHDIGETEDGRLYLVLAHYDGETLKARLERSARPPDEAERIAREIAAGLGAAHAAGIVHRDVKPSNVLLTPSGAKVLDFGIAKGQGDALTRTGTTLGTAAYMSPEQTRGDTVDARTDVWSLGVVLYEMLTGERPFRGRGEALVHGIRHDDPAPLPDGTPAALRRVVDRALAKDPTHRYPDASAMLADFDADPASFTTLDPGRPRWVRWGVGAAVAVLALLAAVWALRPDAAAPDDTFVIAVAPFSAVGAGAEEEAGVMQALVFRELEAVLGQEPGVRLVEIGGEPPSSEEDATAWGQDAAAHLVVWGEAVVLRDEVEIRPQLTRARTVDGILLSPDGTAEGTGTVVTSLTAEDQLALRRTKAAEVGDLALLIAAHYYATRGDYDRALGLYDRVRKPSVESEGAAAFVHYMDGDYERAAERYGVAADMGPMPGFFWFGYATALINLNRIAEAERGMRAGLAVSPENPMLKSGLAWVLAMQGRSEDMQAVAQSIGDVEPQTQAERLAVGWSYFMANRLDEAIPLFQALADRAWSDTERSYGYQGLTISYLSQGRFVEAEEAGRASVRYGPHDGENYEGLGWALLAQGKYEEAEAVFSRAMAETTSLDNPLLVAFLRTRLGQPNADAPIRVRADTLGQDGYLRSLYQFAVGRATESEVVAAAKVLDPVRGGTWEREGHLFLGHVYEAGVGVVPKDSARASFHYKLAMAYDLDPTPVTNPGMSLARLEDRLHELAVPPAQDR